MVSYRDLPGDSTVWIYQSSRELLPEEVNGINELSCDFVLTWAAHGASLKAAIELFYNYFIVEFI